MVVELSGTIRGEAVQVRWADGVLSGSSVLLERLRTLQDAQRVADERWDLTDVGDVVRALELAAAQRLQLRVVNDVPDSRAS